MARLTRAAGIRTLSGALLTLAAVAAQTPLAHAATSPKPIADVHSLGPITLWDKAGHRLTGGSINVPLNSEIAKASAPGPAPAGYRQAVELNMWTPRDGADPSEWDGGPLRAGTPDLIAKDKQTAPLSTTSISDWSLARDILLCNGPSTGSYENRYQLRMMGIVEGPADSPDYYTATIVVDPKAGTWRLLSPSSSMSASSGFPTAAVGGGAVGAAALLAGGGFWWRRRRTTTDALLTAHVEPSA